MLILDFWNTIVAYFKDKPYWSRIQPIITLLSLYLIALILAYQYLIWQFHFSPSISVYLRSYIVKQITLITAGVGALFLVFGYTTRRGRQRRLRHRKLLLLRIYIARSGKRLVLSGAILTLIMALFLYFTPHSVNHIRVRFLDEPEFDEGAFVYILYELNRLQNAWYFEMDFDVFNEAELTSVQRQKLRDSSIFDIAVLVADGKPFIGITSRKIGEDYFWQNQGKVSVVSTWGWKELAPPSIYEFLAHAVIVQSLLIHLNSNAGGLPRGSFLESRVSSNDLFQFTPRRYAMKATILAARLSPEGEELLFNAFGAEYVSVYSKLLGLDWLHSTRVAQNLQHAFGVRLSPD